jgi:hypothetical protein
MKKIILISTITLTGLFANAMTDAVVAKAKNEATTKAVAQVAGNDAVKKEVANKAVDAIKNGTSVDTLKDQAISKAKEKATDMAKEKASEVVGKEAVDTAIKLAH